jgi:hypothetical protein
MHTKNKIAVTSANAQTVCTDQLRFRPANWVVRDNVMSQAMTNQL